MLRWCSRERLSSPGPRLERDRQHPAGDFALLQANVTGYENEEFGVPRINANGTQMRTNYQMDGNTNMQKNRAGLRLAPISEMMVQEVNVVTSGFAPEFGKTTGMVYNVVTPSRPRGVAAREVPVQCVPGDLVGAATKQLRSTTEAT